MAQHGYLREYDEGWDRGENRDQDREGSWRDEDRERAWRGRESRDRSGSWQDDGRRGDERRDNFMFSGRPDRGQGQDQYSRGMGEPARSGFRDDEEQYRGSHQDRWESGGRGQSGGYGREHGYGGFQGDYGRSQRDQGGFGGRGDWERSPRNFSSHQDDHYRSWRDRQMSALDRDYEDYCREREQQFHQDFDTWRQNRQSGSSSQKQSPQKGSESTDEEVMELTKTTDSPNEPHSGPSPVANATLGTNNSENSSTGGRR